MWKSMCVQIEQIFWDPKDPPNWGITQAKILACEGETVSEMIWISGNPCNLVKSCDGKLTIEAALWIFGNWQKSKEFYYLMTLPVTTPKANRHAIPQIAARMPARNREYPWHAEVILIANAFEGAAGRRNLIGECECVRAVWMHFGLESLQVIAEDPWALLCDEACEASNMSFPIVNQIYLRSGLQQAEQQRLHGLLHLLEEGDSSRVLLNEAFCERARRLLGEFSIKETLEKAKELGWLDIIRVEEQAKRTCLVTTKKRGRQERRIVEVIRKLTSGGNAG